MYMLEKSHEQPNMNLYVPGRLHSPQNKPDLRWAMQSYEHITLNINHTTAMIAIKIFVFLSSPV